MDYAKLMFAFHVRELASARLAHAVPDELKGDAARKWRTDRYKQTVIDVVEELERTAGYIDEAKASKD